MHHDTANVPQDCRDAANKDAAHEEPRLPADTLIEMNSARSGKKRDEC